MSVKQPHQLHTSTVLTTIPGNCAVNPARSWTGIEEFFPAVRNEFYKFSVIFSLSSSRRQFPFRFTIRADGFLIIITSIRKKLMIPENTVRPHPDMMSRTMIFDPFGLTGYHNLRKYPSF